MIETVTKNDGFFIKPFHEEETYTITINGKELLYKERYNSQTGSNNCILCNKDYNPVDTNGRVLAIDESEVIVNPTDHEKIPTIVDHVLSLGAQAASTVARHNPITVNNSIKVLFTAFDYSVRAYSLMESVIGPTATKVCFAVAGLFIISGIFGLIVSTAKVLLGIALIYLAYKAVTHLKTTENNIPANFVVGEEGFFTE